MKITIALVIVGLMMMLVWPEPDREEIIAGNVFKSCMAELADAQEDHWAAQVCAQRVIAMRSGQ